MSLTIPSTWTFASVIIAVILATHRRILTWLTPQPYGNVPHRRMIKGARQWPILGDAIHLIQYMRRHRSHNGELQADSKRFYR